MKDKKTSKKPATKRKQRKTPLEERRSAARVDELFLNSILENIPHMIFVKDARDLRFVRFNKAGARLLGIPLAKMIGKNDYDFFPKEEADQFTRKDRAVLVNRKLVDIPQEPIHTKKGVRFLHTKKIPIFSATGKVQYLLGISEDITETKKATEALRRSHAQLESRVQERTAELLSVNESLRTEISERKKAEAALREREERIRQFTEELEQRVQDRTVQLTVANNELEAFSYSVSHDLRAPLRAIEGFSGILIQDHLAALSADAQRLLSVIRKNARQMALLIDDLLNFARIGRHALAQQTIDLHALVHSMIAEINPPDAERKVEIVLKPLPAAFGDGGLLRQVFRNLLSNAQKFTRHNPNPHVEVGCTHDQRERIYYVRDNGVGFDMQYADKLFGVFQRLHTDAEFEGTGVGLAIVQRIIHRHGGRVWAEGKVNEGASFYFTLPLSQAA